MTPRWEHDFDNSPRHCWYVKAANLWMRVGENPDGSRTCETWRTHRSRRGQSGWLRFIHAFADQVDHIDNPFVEEGRFVIFNETDGHDTSDGRHAYCETYLLKNTDDWGVNPVFRVFIDSAHRWTRIECYDETLRTACNQALAAVEQRYADEEEAT